jgi:hypothetical protein
VNPRVVYKKIVPWVGLSLLTGYIAINISNNTSNDTKNYSTMPVSSTNFSSHSSRANYPIDSSHVLEIKRSISDISNNGLEKVISDNETVVNKTTLNNAYLMDRSEQILLYLSRFDQFSKDKINSMLDTVKPAYRKNKSDVPLFHTLDDTFSLGQRLRIYFMLDALKDTSFRNNIGAMIIDDVMDRYAEHGGVVTFDKKNNIKFIKINSSLPRTRHNNDYYYYDMDSIKIPFIAPYHLHASTFEESDFADPSSLDLLSPEFELRRVGETHGFVITSLKKGKFNVDYYGGDKAFGGVKIVDLGVYNYTFSK